MLVFIVTSSNTVTMSLFLFKPNGVVSPSLLLIVYFVFYLFPPCRWVWSLVDITDYIGSPLRAIKLSLYFIDLSLSTMVSYHCQSCWLLFYTVSLVPTQRWMWTLIGTTDYIGSTLVRNDTSSICHFFS